MTTIIGTFYPQAHPETLSVDGYVERAVATEETWAALISGAGVNANDDSALLSIYIGAFVVTDRWSSLRRTILLFDTSAIGSGSTITSATLELTLNSKSDGLGITPSINVYASTPASDTGLVAADYSQVASTPLATAIAWGDIVSSTLFTLNAAGLAAINKTGITKLCIRNANYDVAGVAPTWTYGGTSEIIFYSADETSFNKPTLRVNYNTTANAPVVVTDPATSFTVTGATLNGTLTGDSGGLTTTVSFQYGLTTSYGSVTADQVKVEGQSFSAAITGLTPGTLYHFRAKAVNAVDTVYGSDLTFTTSGSSYPSEAITRVSSLIHRYSEGNYTLEILLGEVVADFGLPEISIKPRPAIPPSPPLLPVSPFGGGTTGGSGATGSWDNAYTCPFDGQTFNSYWDYVWHITTNHMW